MTNPTDGSCKKEITLTTNSDVNVTCTELDIEELETINLIDKKRYWDDGNEVFDLWIVSAESPYVKTLILSDLSFISSSKLLEQYFYISDIRNSSLVNDITHINLFYYSGKINSIQEKEITN